MSQMEKMAANTQRGQMRPNHGSRTPPFVIVGLLVVISILAFNYWSVSSTNRELNDQLLSLGTKYRQNDVVLKKREMVLNEQLKTETKHKDEIRTQVKTLEDSLRSKEVEISDLKSTIGTKDSEIDGLKTELQNEKEKSDNTLKRSDGCYANLTHCNQQLEEGKKECGQKGEELQSCLQREQTLQQEINTLKDKPQNAQDCSTEVNNMRVQLLTKLQQLGGDQVIDLLTKAGVDTSGVVMNKPGDQAQEKNNDQQSNQLQSGNQGQIANQAPLANQNNPAGKNATGLSSANHTTTAQGGSQMKVQEQPSINQSPVIQGEIRPAVQGQPPIINQNQPGNSHQNQSDNQPSMQQGAPPQLQNNPNSQQTNTSNSAQQQSNVDLQINKPGIPQNPDAGSIQNQDQQPAPNQPAQQVGPPKIHEGPRDGGDTDKVDDREDTQDEEMEEDQALKFRGKAAEDIQEEEDDLDRGFN